MPRTRTSVPLVLATILAAGVARGDDIPQPKLGELNRHVLAVIKTYPTDGTHRYNWPKDGSYSGVTEDVIYRGEVVAKANGKGEAFCCGLTFEVFVKAWKRWAKAKKRPIDIGGMDPRGLRRLRSDWFCAGEVRSGPVEALVSRGLGQQIVDLDKAKPGDFMQLWRKSGSGHSVVFVGWVRDRKGERVALKYWSTQRSTKGIGFHTERFAGKSGLVREKLYIARAGVPRKGR